MEIRCTGSGTSAMDAKLGTLFDLLCRGTTADGPSSCLNARTALLPYLLPVRRSSHDDDTFVHAHVSKKKQV